MALLTKPAELIHTPDDPRFGALTRREREVGVCVLLGLGRREIAERLKISPRTVDTHRLHLYAKLDCRTDIALMWRAFEIGWLRGWLR